MDIPQDHRLPEGQTPKLIEAPRKKKAAPSRGKLMLVGAGLGVLLILFFLLGYLPRHKRQKVVEAAAQREAHSLTSVNAAQVRRAPSVSYLLLPGNITPYTEAYLYARATGYVRRRYVDIGDRVRQGQLLAEIEAPDLDAQVAQARAQLAQSEQQLAQARASLENATAQEDLARVTWERYRVLADHGAVSRQEADQQLAAYKQATANRHLQEAAVNTAQENVHATKANLDRMIALQAFEQVRAPFAGVITARNFDVGAFINAGGGSSGLSPTPMGGTQVVGQLGNGGATGSAASTGSSPTAPSASGGSSSGSSGAELFRVAQIGTVRILINVPQENAPGMRAGQPATVLVQEYLGKTFSGKVTRTSSSLDQTSRTLLTEVQVANPQSLLLPGMYAQVQFGDVRSIPPLLIPGDAVITTPNGMQVAILQELTAQDRERLQREYEQRQQQKSDSKDRDNGQQKQREEQELQNARRIHLQRIQVGRDYGPEVEITSGLQGWEHVVVNPGDEVRESAIVSPRAAAPIAGEGAPGKGAVRRRAGRDRHTDPQRADAKRAEGKERRREGIRLRRVGREWRLRVEFQGRRQVRRLSVLAMAATVSFAQTPGAGHWYDRLAGPYMPPSVRRVDFSNSTRIDSLLRAGSLYLSLPDAIALALENNLDVEYERFAPEIAASDLKRAKGGGTLRGISLSVAELPAGVGGPAGPLINAAATGAVASSAVSANISVTNALAPTTSGIVIAGANGISTGPPIPLFDPALVGGVAWQRLTTPEVSNLASGTNTAAAHSLTGNLGVQQGFSTGTLLDLNFNANHTSNNAVNSRLNPYTSSNLGLTFTQPLLRGFSPAVNRRFIRIAHNNEQTSELLFRQQLIATVAGVIRLYDDLVSLTEDVKVKEQTLALAQRLYEDNRLQVEQGTLAPVELTRAQAGVAAAQQDLANSRGYERQQELVLKTVLTRRGTSDAVLRDARVIPTTPIDVPAQEPVRPANDLVEDAFRGRPELQEARLQIDNSRIALSGSRNQLLPALDLVATGQNSGLAGQPNANANSSLLPSTTSGNVGGFGTGLSQVFTGRYPTYSVGVQLNIPLRNRIAQADVARDEIQIRQWEIRFQQLQNQVRAEVEGSLIALEQARAAYDAAVQTRTLQEQSLTIEMEKYSVGLSTNFLVMQYQGYVAQARSTEVAARNVYVKARTALERAIGDILERNNVSVATALHAIR